MIWRKITDKEKRWPVRLRSRRIKRRREQRLSHSFFYLGERAVSADHTSPIMTSSLRFSLLCLAAIISPALLTDPSCKGAYNTHDIVRDEPTFVSSVPNGKRFVVGQDYDKINIAHVYGDTPYDMGVALGSLMKKELQALVPEYFAYLDKTIEDALKILPPVRIQQNVSFSTEFVKWKDLLFLVCCPMDCRIRPARCSRPQLRNHSILYPTVVWGRTSWSGCR